MNYNKKSVEDIDVAGKRVLCRCDFNVPTKDGKITSDKRIVAALPTIQYLVKHNARVILCSHMGKPKGEVKPELSLQVVADRLSELLGQPVKMAKDVVGESAQALAASLKDGEVMLLENTRFEKGETAPVDVETVDVTAIPADKEGLDIGEKTRALFADAIKHAKTVVWNGPMGVFENPTLAKGTIAVAQALADSDAVTIVGGGDSAAACEQLGFADKITHISTGGGASLEFLEGLELPGIACLQDK